MNKESETQLKDILAPLLQSKQVLKYPNTYHYINWYTKIAQVDQGIAGTTFHYTYIIQKYRPVHNRFPLKNSGHNLHIVIGEEYLKFNKSVVALYDYLIHKQYTPTKTVTVVFTREVFTTTKEYL